jgi:predicted dehydrogenase
MKPRVLLVGAGAMAVEYAKVLRAEKIDFEVVGRGKDSAKTFTEKTGVVALSGGLKARLKSSAPLPKTAIVTVDVLELAPTSMALVKAGVGRLLIEKPVALNVKDLRLLASEVRKRRAQAFVAYNRRFYASTRRLRKIIAEDGGVSSFRFEFTEWSHVVAKTPHSAEVKAAWFLGNSTHVVDLAFFLGGRPKRLSTYTVGSLPWHPSASAFSGAGISESGATFSYHADWRAPGRWGVEIMTPKRRLFLQPLEELKIQDSGIAVPQKVVLDDADDRNFKPGLRRQVRAFLSGPEDGLLSIHEHLKQFEEVFVPMAHPALG